LELGMPLMLLWIANDRFLWALVPQTAGQLEP
jgi:hypothetical protein